MVEIIGYALVNVMSIGIPVATVLWLVMGLGIKQYISYYNEHSNRLCIDGPSWFVRGNYLLNNTPLAPVVVIAGIWQFLMALVAFLDTNVSSTWEHLDFTGNLFRIYAMNAEFCAPVAGWVFFCSGSWLSCKPSYQNCRSC